MSVVINPDSDYAKELRKHEQFPMYVNGELMQPGNPYVFRPYPRMLYKAQDWRGQGKKMVTAPFVSPYGWADPRLYENALLEAEAFTKSCQRIVGSEREQQEAEKQGWCDTLQAALEYEERYQQAIAHAAAEAAHSVQGMTATAKREFEEAADSTEHHVTDVVGKKKGAKAVAPADREA